MELQYEEEGWGLFAAFVCAHRTDLQCERPQFARALLGWTYDWFNYTTDKLENESTFWTWIFNNLPIIFGGKVVLCASCRNVIFVSKWSERFFRLANLITNADYSKPMQFTIYPEDLPNFSPQTKSAIMKESLDNTD
jgi:hypothetical protein